MKYFEQHETSIWYIYITILGIMTIVLSTIAKTLLVESITIGIGWVLIIVGIYIFVKKIKKEDV